MPTATLDRPAVARFAAATAEAPPSVSAVRDVATTLPAGVIDGGEIVILAIKPSLWRTGFDAAPWLVATGLLAGGVAWFDKALPGLSTAVTVQVAVVIGLARLALAVMRWVPQWHVLTNRRIIDIHGIRTPRITACPLVHVRNTYVGASLPERITRLGTITFVTREPDRPPSFWRSIHAPHAVHDRIRRAVENAIDNNVHNL
ncbi:MAG: PH domain-containing protein [Phycisphaerae bacterium]